MTARLLVCTFAFGVAVVSACGGATDSGLFGGSSTGDTDSGVGGHDASSTTDAGNHPGSDASAMPDGEAPKDAAPPPKDSAPPPPVDVVACQGTAGCKVGTEACCRKQNGTGFTSSCTPIGQCDQGALEIPCDKQRDCDLLGAPGDLCCVTGGQPSASEVTCRPAAECTSAQGRAAMCDPMVATSCTAPLHCQMSQSTIPGYNICR